MAALSKLELAVDAGKWDGGLRKAITSMNNFTEACEGLGKATEDQKDKMTKFASMLGDMETTSKTARGSLNELKAAFTQLSHEYNRLTDDEKSSPFGKAMSESLDKLKVRIQEGNHELQGIQNQMKGTKNESDNAGGGLQELYNKFGINIGQMAKFGTAAAAVTTAIKVAKDAFFANEEQLDKWGRTVETSQSLYEGFLTSLNTGDISGFLSRIDQIVDAAVRAYNAIDELGTFNAFNQRNELKGRHGFQNAINNYREGKGSKDDIKTAGEAYIKELQKRQTLEGGAYGAKIAEVAAKKGVDPQKLAELLTGDYDTYNKAKNVKPTGKGYTYVGGFGGFGYGQATTVDYAKTPAEKMGEALRMFNDTELQTIQRIGAQEIQTSIEIEGVRRQMDRAMNAKQPGKSGGGGKSTTTTTTGRGHSTPTPHVTERTFTGKIDKANELKTEAFGDFRMSGDILSKADLSQMKAAFQKKMEEATDPATAAVAERMVKTINDYLSVHEVALRVGMNQADIVSIQEQMKSGFDTKNLKPLEIQVNKPTEQQINADGNAWSNISDYTSKRGIDLSGTSMGSITQMVGVGVDVPDSMWEELVAQINEKIEGTEFNKIKIDVETGNVEKAGKDVTESWNNAAKIINSAGSALQNIDNKGVSISGMIMQAIGNVILGFTSGMTQEGMKGGVWGWIAASVAGLATMTATIAQIKSATSGYAEGGRITGGAYTGDAIPIMANAGEIVLSSAMQSNLAENLTSGGGGAQSAVTTIKGEQLITVINNTRKRKGKGEIL